MNKISSLSLVSVFFIALSLSSPVVYACKRCVDDMHVPAQKNEEFDIDSLQELAEQTKITTAPPQKPSRIQRALRKFGLPLATKLIACKNHIVTAYKNIRYGN